MKAHWVLLWILLGAQAQAADSIVITIDGLKAKAEIQLDGPGGIVYDVDFELEFHEVDNLTEACLGLTADVLDPIEIANIESRLPDPVNQRIDPAFPVRVTVEPPAGCGLAFNDEVHVEMDTPELVWAPFSPYRLMKAPIGGAFTNITSAVVAGSIRSRGNSGRFSEFVMVEDQLQDHAGQVTAAFTQLDALLADSRLASTAKQTLEADAATSKAAFTAGDFAAAEARLLELTDHCGVLGGTALPNRWRAARDLDNLEGEIVSRSEHLRFLLGRLGGAP
ncbi:MAG: hypothetical protein KDI48_18945 [Xanthomonadales bacterium]|nr:hypothetical protein [Xanthomonadales bacterium]